MSYETKLAAILKYVPPAVDAVFAEFSEAAISWSKESVVQAIIAKIKLDLPDINSESEAYAVVEASLASLLILGKIQPKKFGYSSLGNEEVNLLFAKYAPTEVAPQKTSQEEYADIVRDYKTLSTYDLSEKKKIPGWLSRFDEAVKAGLL